MSELQQIREMADYWQDVQEGARRQLEYAIKQREYYVKRLGELASNDDTDISDLDIDNAGENR